MEGKSHNRPNFGSKTMKHTLIIASAVLALSACQSGPEYTRADGVTVIPMSVGANEIRDKVDGTIGQECSNKPGRVGVTKGGSYFADCSDSALSERGQRIASRLNAIQPGVTAGTIPAAGSPGFGAK